MNMLKLLNMTHLYIVERRLNRKRVQSFRFEPIRVELADAQMAELGAVLEQINDALTNIQEIINSDFSETRLAHTFVAEYVKRLNVIKPIVFKLRNLLGGSKRKVLNEVEKREINSLLCDVTTYLSDLKAAVTVAKRYSR